MSSKNGTHTAHVGPTCSKKTTQLPSDFLTAGPKPIKGVGADAPVVVNERGGKQSASPFRCDLLPPRATLAVAEVLAHGAAKYGANNWHTIPAGEHLNHALAHVFAFHAGDTQDDHLEHAACRVLMALDQHLAGRPADVVAAMPAPVSPCPHAGDRKPRVTIWRVEGSYVLSFRRDVLFVAVPGTDHDESAVKGPAGFHVESVVLWDRVNRIPAFYRDESGESVPVTLQIDMKGGEA